MATVFQTMELSDEILKTLDDRYRMAGELTEELMKSLDTRYETTGKLTENYGRSWMKNTADSRSPCRIQLRQSRRRMPCGWTSP